MQQNFSSWTVVNNQVIIKHCDKTIFKHGLIVIDKHLYDFFAVENLAPLDHKTITIEYGGITYNANIGATKRPLYRLYVGEPIRTELKQLYNDSCLLDLMIQKTEDLYKFSFVKEDDIVKTLDDCLTTIITFQKNEGKKKLIYTTKYERDPKLRKAAIRIHGIRCCVCDFDFEQRYGSLGKNFIEVHHLKPLHSLCHEERVNPDTDMVCLCSNCHRMIHRKKNTLLTPENLRKLLQ